MGTYTCPFSKPEPGAAGAVRGPVSFGTISEPDPKVKGKVRGKLQQYENRKQIGMEGVL